MLIIYLIDIILPVIYIARSESEFVLRGSFVGLKESHLCDKQVVQTNPVQGTSQGHLSHENALSKLPGLSVNISGTGNNFI